MPKFFSVMDRVKPVYDILYKVVMFICKILLIADILVTCYIVIGRYISFINPPVWGEEIVLTLMVYMAVLSATLAIRKNAHIRMTVFDKYMNKSVIRALDIFADIAVMALGVVLLIYGSDVAQNMSRASFNSIRTLSRFWIYLPMPIAGATMIFFELEQLYQHIRGFFVKDEPPADVAPSEEVPA